MINYPKVKDSIMKQIIRNILFLALILLSSCELSMLEYELPEDQRGKGEPYTEVNEYGEFTYEYNKNVTPLNGDPQNYIATMNDSVLWFMDNMPDKWVPKAGEYIAANCSKTIPLGLCAKVRSVTRENGMIRVEHEPATREEVFKQLNYKIPHSGVISRPAASTSCRSFFIISAGIHFRSTLTVRTRLRLRTMSIGA